MAFKKQLMKIKNICCIGAGYVGGPTMAVIALKCPKLRVTVVDSNHDRIKDWNGPLDNLPVYEPGLEIVIKEARGRNLFFSENVRYAIENSEIIFMAVNTPTKTEGPGAGMAADLSYIESCAKQIAKYAKTDKIIVEKSTVPIKTAEKINEILKKENRRVKFEILSNPEFLAEGTAIEDMFNPDRVLIGGESTETGKKAIKSLVDIYTNWIPKKKILTTNVWSSELAKLASNAMLAQRISSINSLSALCEKTGADIDELSKAIGMDQRIGPHFLKASVGFGGSCFQKDILNLVYLCRFYGLDEVSKYWHQVVIMNDYQKNRFSEIIINSFEGKLENKKIAVMGWAFKANTNDSRESPSISVVEKLYNAGADIEIFDPLVSEKSILNDIRSYWRSKPNRKIQIFDKLKNDFNDFDAIIILTEWDGFKSIQENLNDKVLLFDGRNILVKKKQVYSIGKK